MSSNQSSIGTNLVNLGELIERVSTFGAKYNPVRSEFTIPRLIELQGSIDILISQVQTAENIDNNSIATRALAFKSNDGLVTHAINSFSISGASEQSIRQAESKVRAYRNIRVSDKPSEEDIATAKAEGKNLRINTMHSATFDKKTENMGDFIDFLANSPEYGPNESDISIEGLSAKLAELKSKNKNCSKTSAELDAVRRNRDIAMFAKGTGMVDLAMGVKKYVKSVFGATSIQYKEISDLKFKNIKTIVNQIAQESEPMLT